MPTRFGIWGISLLLGSGVAIFILWLCLSAGQFWMEFALWMGKGG